MGSGSVSGIHVYPIKSCRGISLDQALVSGIGLANDRRWQLIGNSERRGVTQRQHRILATIQPRLIGDGGLAVSAPGMPEIEVALPEGPTISVDSHFRVPVAAVDAGDEAATWFSEIVGEQLRLVRMLLNPGWRLPSNLDVFGQNAPFTDAAPLLIATEASFAWLRDHASEDFGMDRFRPNLVIDGTDPWEEDRWGELSIGSAQVQGIVPWPRCAIPQIDQRTGERHKEPAKVLKSHRWCTTAPTVPGDFRGVVEGNGLFGLACTIRPEGARVRLGDRVAVISTVEPVLSMP